MREWLLGWGGEDEWGGRGRDIADTIEVLVVLLICNDYIPFLSFFHPPFFLFDFS